MYVIELCGKKTYAPSLCSAPGHPCYPGCMKTCKDDPAAPYCNFGIVNFLYLLTILQNLNISPKC